MKKNFPPIRILPATRPETAKKYHSKHVWKNRMIQDYLHALLEMAARTGATDVFEVGCGEVLKHLEHPEKALEIIAGLSSPYFIVTVPREPIWRFLQLASLKNIKTLGNTPGHINHWSKRSFSALVRHYGEILEVRSPLHFTMLLCKRIGE